MPEFVADNIIKVKIIFNKMFVSLPFFLCQENILKI